MWNRRSLLDGEGSVEPDQCCDCGVSRCRDFDYGRRQVLRPTSHLVPRSIPRPCWFTPTQDVRDAGSGRSLAGRHSTMTGVTFTRKRTSSWGKLWSRWGQVVSPRPTRCHSDLRNAWGNYAVRPSTSPRPCGRRNPRTVVGVLHRARHDVVVVRGGDRPEPSPTRVETACVVGEGDR